MRFLPLATLMLMGTAYAAAPTKIDGATIDRWDPAMDAIVPKDWKIEKLAEGFGWAEGPIWVKSGGYLLFTDVPGNKMWKWSEKGGLEKFLDPSGAANPDMNVWREAGANGLAILDKKSILLADTGIIDLAPLQGMLLEDIRLTPKNITKGLDVLRDMNSLKTIGVHWDRAWPAAEFWERYDKGEFKE